MKSNKHTSPGRKSEWSETFRRSVVQDFIENDLNYREVAAKYNVNRGTIHYWVKNFSSDLSIETIIPEMTPEEEKEVAALKRKLEELQKSLELSRLKVVGL